LALFFLFEAHQITIILSSAWAVTPKPESSNFKKALQTAVGKDYELL
jgi:hypothetical protein